ncbi:hypothetical protein ACAF76_021290 [Brevibacillus sp. TJ4]|uniref:hypothetical protein n=1 Tax=Brevibacillus sp. TJ4 TaxID=3234853 RepID=UPI0037D30C69
MTWFKEIPMPLDNHSQHRTPEDYSYRIRPLQQQVAPNPPDYINDIVLQWVVVPFLVIEHVVFHIPVHDAELKEYTFANLTHLFDPVRGFFVDGELLEVRLEGLKQHTKDFFVKTVVDTNKLDPLVADFYLRENMELEQRIDVKLYEIDIKKFTAMTTYHPESNHSRLWDFLMWTHPYHDEITLFPVHWVFHDLLLESPFLLFLSRYADEIVLTVNQHDQHVRAITFTGKRQSIGELVR